MSPRLLIIAILSALSLLESGCRRDLTTAQGVVEEFLDQHYVYIDLPKAKQYCTGLALQKVDEEIQLTRGQAIDSSTRKPKVSYRLVEAKESGTGAAFIYEGTIEVEDAQSFTRRWLVRARKDENRWRISNFSEYES